MADISKIRIESGTYDIKDETARDSITTINSQINTINSKFTKMLTFGDSWTGNVLNADGTGTLANPTCNWANLVANALGLTLENYAIGGYAIHSGASNLRTEIDRAIANISSDHRDDYKYIFVLMGVNDWQGSASPDDILDTTRTDLNLIKQNFPNSQVIFIPLNYFAEDLDNRARNIYSAFVSASLSCNVSMIPNFYNYLNTFSNYFYKDESQSQPSHPYAHPNDSGHRMIKTLVLGALNGKAYPLDFPLVLDTTDRTSSNVYVSKNVCTTNTENFSLNCEITINSGVTFTPQTYYELGRFKYGGANVHVSRFYNYIANILPFNDNFAELSKEYGLLIYLTKDGRLRMISKRTFTTSGDIIIQTGATIYRAI